MLKDSYYRLLICQYYDELMNKIDINTENLLLKSNQKQILEINSIRDQYIDAINNAKLSDLKSCDKVDSLINQLDSKINGSTDELFYISCFFIDHDLLDHSVDCLDKIGFLVLTDSYLAISQVLSIIDCIHDEWGYLTGAEHPKFMRSTKILSKEYLCAYSIIQKIIKIKDIQNQIIRLSFKSFEPIRINNAALSTVDKSVLEEHPIIELNISYIDDIESLSKSVLDNYYLESLVIHHSTFSSLNLDRFKCLKKLHLIHKKSIYVGENSVKLRANFFRSLTHLEDLKIDGISMFESCQEDQFECLTSLKKLNLNNTDIVIYDRANEYLNELTKLKNITDLNLSNCNLINCSLGFLEHLPNLELLDLSHNKIRKINKQDCLYFKAFSRLSKLKQLNLSHNQIKIINSKLFAGLDNLEILNLENNDLTEALQYSFIYMTKLRVLNLKNNDKKDFVYPNSFKGLDLLEELYSEACIAKEYILCNMPNLKILVLDSDNIKCIDDAFGIKNLEKIICGDKLFICCKSFHLNNFENIKDMSIRLSMCDSTNNYLSCLLKGLRDLTRLKIDINPFDGVLSSTIFDYDFQKLNELSLKSEKIFQIDENAFDRLINLKKLTLWGMKLTCFDGRKIFKNLHKLEFLDLSINKIENIVAHSFDSLFNLKVLKLIHNRLKCIDLNLFDKLSRLETLYLQTADNNLSRDHFKSLKSLKEMILYYNDFNNIDNDIFHHLNSIRKLEIGNSSFLTIPENFFSNCVNIRHLSICSCPIKFIHPRAFSNLKYLNNLRISGTYIETLDQAHFENNKRLKNLEIYDNLILKNFDFDLVKKLPELKRFFFKWNLIKLNESSIKINIGNNIEINSERVAFKSDLFWYESISFSDI